MACLEHRVWPSYLNSVLFIALYLYCTYRLYTIWVLPSLKAHSLESSLHFKAYSLNTETQFKLNKHAQWCEEISKQIGWSDKVVICNVQPLCLLQRNTAKYREVRMCKQNLEQISTTKHHWIFQPNYNKINDSIYNISLSI